MRSAACLEEEVGGVRRRRAIDQTEVSTMMLILVGVAACSHSLTRNQ